MECNAIKPQREDNTMRRYYNLVISVLDTDGNRIDTYDITGCNNKKEILADRKALTKEIADGKYDKLKMEGHTLCADIEVHNDDTYELLYII